MLKKHVLWSALFGCSLGVAACYPGEIDSTAQTDLVITFHQEGADFQANATFAIPDSIVDIGVAAGGSSTLDHQYDTQILTKIAQELTALGYTQIFDTTVQADVIVAVSAIKVDNYSYYVPGYPAGCYYCWWGGWPLGYGPGTNWYYPWYPVYSTQFTSGTLFITMLDPDVPPPEAGDIVSIWSAAINGMLEGTNQEILARISNNISQAFDQSPYLAIQ